MKKWQVGYVCFKMFIITMFYLAVLLKSVGFVGFAGSFCFGPTGSGRLSDQMSDVSRMKKKHKSSAKQREKKGK